MPSSGQEISECAMGLGVAPTDDKRACYSVAEGIAANWFQRWVLGIQARTRNIVWPLYWPELHIEDSFASIDRKGSQTLDSLVPPLPWTGHTRELYVSNRCRSCLGQCRPQTNLPVEWWGMWLWWSRGLWLISGMTSVSYLISLSLCGCGEK